MTTILNHIMYFKLIKKVPMIVSKKVTTFSRKKKVLLILIIKNIQILVDLISNYLD